MSLAAGRHGADLHSRPPPPRSMGKNLFGAVVYL